MNKWTKERLDNIDIQDFIISVLNEKKDDLPTPKINESIRYVEKSTSTPNFKIIYSIWMVYPNCDIIEKNELNTFSDFFEAFNYYISKGYHLTSDNTYNIEMCIYKALPNNSTGELLREFQVFPFFKDLEEVSGKIG